MLGVIAGADRKDPTSLQAPVPNYVAAEVEHVPGTSIGVDWDYVSTGVDDDVIATVREALDRYADLGG